REEDVVVVVDVVGERLDPELLLEQVHVVGGDVGAPVVHEQLVLDRRRGRGARRGGRAGARTRAARGRGSGRRAGRGRRTGAAGTGGQRRRATRETHRRKRAA